ncbi:hypothetical protein HYPSUDRAFT_44611 [Hypholoma sublateritium FD-334 SS-4]|uniref:Uncharacterized protein n=1 Tax=Hypholoma sublateritium (strain FD-334 SS-4) TaxID=945553 RepID=A0A0D2NQU2_HYPSF|nr:hypothetical protein HYPSUDRAFT_44611 [Hypholoma sublateritium FD-334 SS-4]
MSVPVASAMKREAQGNACDPNANGNGTPCLPTVPITTTGLPSTSVSSLVATSSPAVGSPGVVSPPSSDNGRVITGVSVGVILFFALVLGTFFWLLRRRREEKKKADSEQGPRKWDALSSRDSERDPTNSPGSPPHGRTPHTEKARIIQPSSTNSRAVGSSPRKPSALPALPPTVATDGGRDLLRTPSSFTSSHIKAPPMHGHSHSVGKSVSAAEPVNSPSAECTDLSNSSMGLRFSPTLFVPGPITRSDSISTTTHRTAAKRYSVNSASTASTSSHSTSSHSSSSHASVAPYHGQSSKTLLLPPSPGVRSDPPGRSLSRKPNSIRRKPVPTYDDSIDGRSAPSTSSSSSRVLPTSSAGGAHHTTGGQVPLVQNLRHLTRNGSFESNSTAGRSAHRLMPDPYAGFQI